LTYKAGTLIADSNAIFKATITGGSGILSYIWQSAKTDTSWTDLTETNSVVGTKTANLLLIKPKISDNPNYHLVVSSSGIGCQSATSATAVLTFEALQAPNMPPVALDDIFTTTQGVAVSGNVSLNDSDPENTLHKGSFVILKATNSGRITMDTTGIFTYTPLATFYGNDTASYRVCDKQALCDTALIVIKVTKVNRAPSINNDVFTTKLNIALQTSVATNDSDLDNDLRKNSYKIVQNPLNGNVKMWANGDVLYLPKQNYLGRDSFTYQACDSSGLCNTATVVVTISGGFIKGKIFYDNNFNNVFNAGEYELSNEFIIVNNETKYATKTNGDFQIPVDTMKTYTIKPIINNPRWTTSPLFRVVTTGQNFEQVIDSQYFTMKPVSIINDLAVNVELGNARPGFASATTITYANKGTSILNGKLNVTLDNNTVFESADTAFAQRNGNILTWNFASLKPFESRNITIMTKTNISAPLGNNVTIDYEGTLASGVDIDVTNNKGTAAIEIKGSYDPNDIAVDKETYIRKANDATTPNIPLTYTIRFQNTGNAEAYRVEVVDTIHEKLDLPALEMIGASHKFDMFVELDTHKVKKPYTVVRWVFDNINLPDSTSKEACSHGFVKYAIKNVAAKTNYMKDSILNTAAIYFDFNPPVITNTIATKFSTLTISSIQENNISFKAFPNPTQGILTIQLENGEETAVTIATVVGQVVKKMTFNGTVGQINLDDLASGTYLLTLKTAKGYGTMKVFKN
jgi:uncharacterized repeat protein (TIGR01451 family)